MHKKRRNNIELISQSDDGFTLNIRGRAVHPTVMGHFICQGFPV